jgi:hypothetical protein
MGVVKRLFLASEQFSWLQKSPEQVPENLAHLFRIQGVA